jgi:hypothetical protein
VGFDNVPDPLPLGFPEPFRGEAQPGGRVPHFLRIRAPTGEIVK